MMNESALVPQVGLNDTLPPQAPVSPKKKEKTPFSKPQKPLQKDVPVDKWIMPPEQQGYIQGNDRDCL
jgi:hypothetical protein